MFYLKQLTNVFHTIEFEKLNSSDAILLLTYCGSVAADSSREQRNTICQDVFKGLQIVRNLNIQILNRYIKTCTENNIPVIRDELLASCTPDSDTYKLLLENVSQFGKIEEALNILEAMKNKNIPLDSDCISFMILAHTLKGGLASAESVVGTIRTAHISEDSTIVLALIKGLIRRGDPSEFRKAVNRYHISLTYQQFLEILEELGLKGLDSWISEIYDFYKHLPITRDIQTKIETICIHLVNMGNPISAFNIYDKFVEPHSDVAYGLNLLSEMLYCSIETDTIISIAKSVLNKHPYILECLTEIALKCKYVDESWKLLKSLETVRPHYFWPIFVYCGRKYGENGVFSTLERVVKEFNVKIDAETLEKYVIHYCSLTNLKLLLLKLQDYGFTVKEILSPLLCVLLKQKEILKASYLCSQYNNVDIFGEDFLELLGKSWMFSKESSSVLNLLARYCESNKLEKDLVGKFLLFAAQHCKTDEDFSSYLGLIKIIGTSRLKMRPQSSDAILEICKPFTNRDTEKDLNNNLQLLVDIRSGLFEHLVLPHPSSMDIDGLECHLIELKEKGMATRGVLRKLIQKHASIGNLQRVDELRNIFIESGYEESVGMKSSLMHSYITGGYLDEAMDLYDQIKALHPDFRLDNFKVLDFVRLLVLKDKFHEGYDILRNETIELCEKNVGNIRGIERNCKQLLDACKTAEQVDMIFNLLLQRGLCVGSNVILGPLIKIHLKSGDVDKAVERYTEFSKQFKCTPLQLEILKDVAVRDNVKQLDDVLRATAAVHGEGPAIVGLIAALAENGQDKDLLKVLIDLQLPVHGLLRNRCKRWITERKVEPLKCLANACCKAPRGPINIDFVYECIFDIYDLNGDYDGAVTVFENLSEDLRSFNIGQKLKNLSAKYNKTIS